MNIMTCGTFDLYHTGHSNILKKCKQINPKKKLIVGVSSDFLNIEKKNRLPIMSIYDRYSVLKDNKNVDEVFIEEEYTINSKINYMKI